MKKLVLLMAALALMLMPFTVQATGNDNNANDNNIEQSLSVDIEKDIKENTEVKIKKDVDVEIDANVDVHGLSGIRVEGVASAVVNNNQILKFNDVENIENPNNATLDGNALKNATGNIGVNVVAGDNNAQDNLAAISASDEDLSMADAEIFKTQLSILNRTRNVGRTNNATLSGDALMNAEGNIGVNVAAGNNNAQSNMLAIAVAPARVGIATITIHQEAAHNMTMNMPVKVDELIMVPVELSLSASGSASSTSFGGGYIGGYGGNQSGTYSGSASGSVGGNTSGMSYQANNFYPDIWVVNENVEPHNQHPNSPAETGHLDMDYQTQGAIANPDRPGVGGLAFDNTGTFSGRYSGGESGTYRGTESGIEGGILGGSIGAQRVDLLGSVYGSVPVVITRNVNMVNNATLSGNALMNASGNIGVNVAAGTGNLQANALAVSYIGPISNGNGGGE